MGNMCGSPPELPPNPHFIDLTHFELLKVVGKGGFGKVNAIQRRLTGKLMALKRMSKCEVIKKESHIRMVWTERNIMAKLESPFLCTLEHSFQSEKELFFVMPFMQGGDLRFHLSKRGTMSERECRFYAAEMVLGLEEMHRKHIVYRDMKPDNLLLDGEGHLRLSDFGLSVELDEKNGYKIKGNAGTSGYLAPEVCAGESYGCEPDVWSFGVTVYELLHGKRPWRQYRPEKNSSRSLKFHPDLSPQVRSFITGLLMEKPSQRLACGKRGWDEVKEHAFFRKIDWVKLANKELPPPIKPDQEHANCSNQADLADQLIDKKPEPISAEYQQQFNGFEWNIDISKMDLRVKIALGLAVDPEAPAPDPATSLPNKKKPHNVLTTIPSASASSSARPSFSVDPAVLNKQRGLGHGHTSSISIPNQHQQEQKTRNDHPHIIPTPSTTQNLTVTQLAIAAREHQQQYGNNTSPPQSFDSTRRLTPTKKNPLDQIDPANMTRAHAMNMIHKQNQLISSSSAISEQQSQVAIHNERESMSSNISQPVVFSTGQGSPIGTNVTSNNNQVPPIAEVAASA